MAGIGDYKGKGEFRMKNPALATSAKYKTPINYASPTKDYSIGKGSHDHPHSGVKYASPMKNDKSASEKQDIKDQELINKAADNTKTGGKGSYDEDKELTLKAKRRQETRGSYEKSKKELRKEVGGSKIKNLFTSKEKLRSRANAKRLRDIKTTEGQAMDTETKNALGGDKYTKTS